MEPNGVVRTELLTGPAGSGKTFVLKQRIEENPDSAVLCATTGVAAVNLNTTTINSLLGYYDTADLLQKYTSGHLDATLRGIASKKCPKVVDVDEMSMMPAAQLDALYDAMYSVNMGDSEHEPLKHPLGLTLTGDFCQLPPVSTREKPAHWAFKAKCWPMFAANTTRLTKIWRQTDPGFLDAINHARAGRGNDAAVGLRSLGVEFCPRRDMHFDGTTIIANNEEVDKFNSQRLAQINEPSFALSAQRWGVQDRSWSSIPNVAYFKPTCLVMILNNKKYGKFSTGHDSPYMYVNGDLADVIEYVPETEARIEDSGYGDAEDVDFFERPQPLRSTPGVLVINRRTGEEVFIAPITRFNTLQGKPDDLERILGIVARMKYGPVPQVGTYAPYYNEEAKRWIIGSVTYFPLRLAYCTTVHKSQGLTLDRVQVDVQAPFFGMPGMAYVALSRVRAKEGLRIVGNVPLLGSRIKLNPEVKEYL